MRRLILILALALLLSVSVLYAQDACPVLAELSETCTDVPLDSLCSPDGEIILLPDLPVETAEAAVIRLSGSDDESAITLQLLGVALVNYERSASSGPLVEISNRAGYNVNLRGGPGATFDVVGTFNYDETLLADGRSADGQWFRVQLDSGPAWVGAGLVAVDPALDDLPVVDQSASTMLSGHALTVAGITSGCYPAQGVLSATSAETAQRLSLNDMPVSVTNGSAFIELGDDHLMVFALAGEIGLGASAQAVDVGTVVQWAVDGLASPDPVPAFPPLDVLEAVDAPEELCLIAAADSDVTLTAFTDPDSAADMAQALDASRSYPAVQQSGDSLWLRVAEAYGSGWLPAENLLTWGVCDSLPEQAEAAPAFGAGLAPDQVMMRYLEARVVADRATMSALACSAYQGQVALQAQSFRAMQAELLGVTCSTTQQNGSSAVVVCSGSIRTNYNGELRQWPPGSYVMTLEDNAWRVCGEAG